MNEKLNLTFSPDDIFQIFTPALFDQESCTQALLSFFGKTIRCPLCQRELDSKYHAIFETGRSVKCVCGKAFNIWKGTALEGVRMSPSELFFACILLSTGSKPIDLSRRMSRGRCACYSLAERLRGSAGYEIRID